MGQQLHIRYKRQRRKDWIERKKKADRAKKPVAAPKADAPATPANA
jgi:hypothetical protein